VSGCVCEREKREREREIERERERERDHTHTHKCRYKIPEIFEKQMRVGAIVECEVQDEDSHKTQWVPAKVVRIGPLSRPPSPPSLSLTHTQRPLKEPTRAHLCHACPGHKQMLRAPSTSISRSSRLMRGARGRRSTRPRRRTKSGDGLYPPRRSSMLLLPVACSSSQ